MPERAGPHLPREARPINGFSVARIYSNFQLARAEHFPEGLSEAAFELLVDLYQYDWLNRWAGAPQDTGMALAGTDVSGGAVELVEANLIVMEQPLPDAGAAPTIRLTPSARIRVSTYLDTMASYISMI